MTGPRDYHYLGHYPSREMELSYLCVFSRLQSDEDQRRCQIWEDGLDGLKGQLNSLGLSDLQSWEV